MLETPSRPSHAGLVQTATVLATDMVASTQLRARLGDAAADVVVAQHDALVDDVLRATGGRLVKRMGDGVLAVFSSAKQALWCSAGSPSCGRAVPSTASRCGWASRPAT